MTILIVILILLILWSIINTFLSFTAIMASKMNNDEIEAIKSWYPFCEIMKMRISDDKGGEDNEP